VAAGVYNLAWGAVSALRPGWFFQLAGMEPPRYPEIWACLGMVIGLYGVLYLEVARVPERGALLAGVGLAGKVLGPLGFATLVLQGRWPVESAFLVITNDLIWWIPFGLYLHDVWSFRTMSSEDVCTGKEP
jgi:hypothetical protein